MIGGVLTPVSRRKDTGCRQKLVYFGYWAWEIHNITLKASTKIWSRRLLNYTYIYIFFFYFSEIASRLFRRFTWKVKTCFLWKIRKKIKMSSAAVVTSALRVKKQHLNRNMKQVHLRLFCHLILHLMIFSHLQSTLLSREQIIYIFSIYFNRSIQKINLNIFFFFQIISFCVSVYSYSIHMRPCVWNIKPYFLRHEI